ncbi:MAG: PIG-L family deacetylase [Acidobacteriaceae bacterium]|nr:PIG-L family deacetylase [Acidobacteriaceae bacterium]
MLRLTVLSPHRDDAVFSLFFALSRWVNLGVRVRILNFFTRSAYAPYTRADDVAHISDIRAREDRRALRKISPRAREFSLHLLDAPLRLGIQFDEVFRTQTARLLTPDWLQTLATEIAACAGSGLLLAPLTLGNHVDHVAVNRAALHACGPKRLGFYEDLPYAIWTDGSTVRKKVREMEAALKLSLYSATIAPDRTSMSKQFAAGTYSSQITREEAVAIARRAERIWIPKSRFWTELHSI